MTAFHRKYFSTARPVAEIAGAAPVAGIRGLLPNAASRILSGSTPPTVRRIDDKGRVYHPPLADLPGWVTATDCTVVVDDDFLRVCPTDRPGRDLGRFDGRRLRVPAARLAAIGVAPGEDVAVLVDTETGEVTLAAGAHLTDAFGAVGELEQLRNQLSQVTAERNAAIADAKKAHDRVDVLTELLRDLQGPRSTRSLTPLHR